MDKDIDAEFGEGEEGDTTDEDAADYVDDVI